MSQEQQRRVIQRMDKQVPLLWVFIAPAISCLLLTLLTIGYVSYMNHRNNQQWCELVTFYDDLYRSNPPNPQSPTYEIQKKNAELMHRRRVNLGCKDTIK